MHLTPRDGAILITAASTWILGVLLAHALWQPWSVEIGVLLAMGLLLAGQFEIYRRTLQSQKELHGRPTANYRQVEALFSLFATLPIDHPLPPMRAAAASPDFALSQIRLIRQIRPGVILELGSGVSTLIAAYAVRQIGTGRIVSLEQDAGYAEVTRRNLAERGLQDWARVVHAPLHPIELAGRTWTWYDLSGVGSLGTIDMLVVDGPLQEGRPERLLRYPALPVLLDRLGAGAIVLLDDTDREDEGLIIERWLKEFPRFQREVESSEKGTVILRRTG